MKKLIQLFCLQNFTKSASFHEARFVFQTTMDAPPPTPPPVATAPAPAPVGDAALEYKEKAFGKKEADPKPADDWKTIDSGIIGGWNKIATGDYTEDFKSKVGKYVTEAKKSYDKLAADGISDADKAEFAKALAALQAKEADVGKQKEIDAQKKVIEAKKAEFTGEKLTKGIADYAATVSEYKGLDEGALKSTALEAIKGTLKGVEASVLAKLKEQETALKTATPETLAAIKTATESLPKDMITLLSSKNPDAAQKNIEIKSYLNGIAIINSEGNARFPFLVGKAEADLKVPAAILKKWKDKFDAYKSSPAKMPKAEALMDQIKSAQTEVLLYQVLGTMPEEEKAKLKLALGNKEVTPENLSNFLQKYKSFEYTKEKISVQRQAVLAILAEAIDKQKLDVEIVVEGKADSEEIGLLESRESQYAYLREIAKRISSGDLRRMQSIPQVEANLADITAYAGSSGTAHSFLSPKHKTEKAKWFGAGGVLNTLLFCARGADVSGAIIGKYGNIRVGGSAALTGGDDQGNREGQVSFCSKGLADNKTTNIPVPVAETPVTSPTAPDADKPTPATVPVAPAPTVPGRPGETAPVAPTPAPEAPGTPTDMRAIPVEGVEVVGLNGNYKKEGGKLFFRPMTDGVVTDDTEFTEVDEATLNVLRGIDSPLDYADKLIDQKVPFLDKTLLTGKTLEGNTLTLTFNKTVDGEDVELEFSIDILTKKVAIPGEHDLSPFVKPGLTKEAIAKLQTEGWNFNTLPEGIEFADPVEIKAVSDLLDATGNLKDPAKLNTLIYYFTKIEAANLAPEHIAISKDTLKQIIAGLDLNEEDSLARVTGYFADTGEAIKFALENNAKLDFDTVKGEVGDEITSDIFKLFAKKFTENQEWQKNIDPTIEVDATLGKNLIKAFFAEKAAIPTVLVQFIDNLEDLHDLKAEDDTTSLSPEMTKKIQELITNAVKEKATLPGNFNALVDALYPEKDKIPVAVRAQYEFKVDTGTESKDLNAILASLQAGQEKEFLTEYLSLCELDEDNANYAGYDLTLDINKYGSILKEIANTSPMAQALWTKLLENAANIGSGPATPETAEKFKETTAELKAQYLKALDKNVPAEQRWAILETLNPPVTTDGSRLNDEYKKAIAGSAETYNNTIPKAFFDTAYELSREGNNGHFAALEEEDIPKDATADQKAYFEALKTQDSDTLEAVIKHINEGKYSPSQLESVAALYLASDDVAVEEKIGMLTSMKLEGKAESFILENFKYSTSKIANIHLIKLSKYQPKAKEMLEEAYQSLIGEAGKLAETADKQEALDIIEACLEHGIDKIGTTTPDGLSEVVEVDDQGILRELMVDADASIKLQAKHIKAKYELAQCTDVAARKELCEGGELLVETNDYLTTKDTLEKSDYDFAAEVFANSPSLETLKDLPKQTAYVQLLFKLVSQDEPQKAHREAFLKISPELIAKIADDSITAKYNEEKNKATLENANLTTTEGQKAYIAAVVALDEPTAEQLTTAAKYADKDQLTAIVDKTEDLNVTVSIYLAAFAGNLKTDKDSTLLKAYASVKDEALGAVAKKALSNALSSNGHNDEAFYLINNDESGAFSIDDKVTFLVEKKISSGKDLNDILYAEADGIGVKERFEKIASGVNKDLFKEMTVTDRAKLYIKVTEGKTAEEITKIKELLQMDEAKAEEFADHKFTLSADKKTLTVEFVKEDGTKESKNYTLNLAPYFSPKETNSGPDHYLGLGGSLWVDFASPDDFRPSGSNDNYELKLVGSEIQTVAKRNLHKITRDNKLQVTLAGQIQPDSSREVDLSAMKWHEIKAADGTITRYQADKMAVDTSGKTTYQEGCLAQLNDGRYMTVIAGKWSEVHQIN